LTPRGLVQKLHLFTHMTTQYSFVEAKEKEERPTVRVPVEETSRADLEKKLAEIEEKIAGLMVRRASIKRQLEGKRDGGKY